MNVFNLLDSVSPALEAITGQKLVVDIQAFVGGNWVSLTIIETSPVNTNDPETNRKVSHLKIKANPLAGVSVNTLLKKDGVQYQVKDEESNAMVMNLIAVQVETEQ